MSLIPGSCGLAGARDFPLLCKYFSQQSPQPMVAVEGRNHVVRYVNPAFSKLVGIPESRLVGRRFTEVVPEGEANGSRQLLDRVFDSGTAEIIVDQRHTQSTISYWTYSMWAIIGEEGLAAGVMIQITDVTGAAVFREQMAEMNQALALSGIRQHELTEVGAKLNASLKSANQAKSLFLANMSHEIRTPLGAILGYSDLLREPELSSDEKISFIDTISRNGRELTRIIDDILDLSKIEAGCLNVERIKTSLPDLILDITTSLSVKAREQAIDLVVVSTGDIPETISTDPTRLRQILLNIVGNGLKFSHRGSVKVTVKILSPGPDRCPQVAFIVEDTGCGISQQGQAKLFSHFAQADSSTTREFGGSGLGLILSRNLARALGGDVVLESSIVGKGSVFVVTVDSGGIDETTLLPDIHAREIRLTPAQVAAARNELARVKQLAGISVLLVDDAPDNRLLISRILTMNGAKVDTAHNGVEAVEKALAATYDVVLMDIQMPLLDGYDAMKRLKVQGYRQSVIALTAHALAEEREKSRGAGFSEHLTKPVDTKRLIEAIIRSSRKKQNDAFPCDLH